MSPAVPPAVVIEGPASPAYLPPPPVGPALAPAMNKLSEFT